MCTVCGCGTSSVEGKPGVEAKDGHSHEGPHDHAHDHDHARPSRHHDPVTPMTTGIPTITITAMTPRANTPRP